MAGIFMNHLGVQRAMLLYLEKPPSTGRNNQQLHLLKLSKVPDSVRRTVELQTEAPDDAAR
jgi:hypothetical protein